MVVRLPLFLLAVSAAAGGGRAAADDAGVRDVAPGGGELHACITSGAARCHLLPGVHREHAAATDGARLRAGSAPLTLSGAPGSVLSGSVPVPGPWSLHKGEIYKTQLPAALRNREVQQAWARQTWLPEARWPNTNLTKDAPATNKGGPLSLSSWATSYGFPGQTDNCTNCTRLRKGIIVDPTLAETGIDFTGSRRRDCHFADALSSSLLKH